jgi:tetratricopeptide (TPR) repeat protein
MTGDERLSRAQRAYEQAVFGGDPSGLEAADRELDTVEADVALARGRLVHARYLADRLEDPRELALFERAAELYRGLGDERGEAEALFWVGTCHQVVRQANDAALPALRRSRELATQSGDELTLSYALRHLAIAAHGAGRLDEARALLEESTRLRRSLGFLPGVAANLVGLAYLAAAQERHDDAGAMLDEARRIATEHSAAGLIPMIEQAARDLGPSAAAP